MTSVRSAALIAGVVVSVFPAVAYATNTHTTHNLNLRTGPGIHYAVATVIPAGSTVDIVSCGSRWCVLHWAGHQGYSDGNYLLTHVTTAVPVLSHVHHY